MRKRDKEEEGAGRETETVTETEREREREEKPSLESMYHSGSSVSDQINLPVAQGRIV